MAVDVRLRHFRFGTDGNSEQTHGWLAAEDTSIVRAAGSTFLLRFAIWEEGGSDALDLSAQFQYKKGNTGPWTNITTTSSVCKAVAVGAFTDGQSCTQRLTLHGTFDPTNAGCTEDGTSGGTTNDLVSNGSTETECGLQLVSGDVQSGEVIWFRLTVSYTGGTTIAYDVIPYILVNEPSESPSLSPSGSASVSHSGSLSESASTSLESPDYGRPTADLAFGSWTPSTGSDLYAMVDEEAADDADYIRSGAAPVDDTAILRLTGLILPGPGTVTLRLRAKWSS